MRPEGRRRTGKAPDERVRTFAKRAGTGEKKGCKRMAETGCVFDVVPPGQPRTPEQVMGLAPGAAGDGPPGGEPLVHLRYHRQPRRDHRHAARPGRAPRPRPCPALDRPGGRGQPPDRRAPRRGGQAGRHDHDHDRLHPRAGIPVESGLVLPPAPRPRDGGLGHRPGPGHPARPGRRGDQPDRAARRRHPPRPGSEHEKIIRKTLHYLQAKQPYLDYPRALANGWPIATGVIEGACRHLVQDRMGITGARWGLQGAQSMLWLRAIAASGDHDAYWAWHITRKTTATTAAATRTPPASNSPHNPHSKRAAPMSYRVFSSSAGPPSSASASSPRAPSSFMVARIPSTMRSSDRWWKGTPNSIDAANRRLAKAVSNMSTPRAAPREINVANPEVSLRVCATSVAYYIRP